MNGRFNGFKSSDFAAFQERKKESPRYNSERKVVWEKMKNLQCLLEPKLRQRGFMFEGKISHYWLSRELRLNGIRLAFTDIEPFRVVCQLNCGIYRRGFFAGIEINSKASSYLDNVLNYISQNEKEFLSYIKRLDPDFVQVEYGNYQLGPSRFSTSDVDELIEKLRTKRDWFSLGEWYPKSMPFLKNANIVDRITDVFETLFPLYPVFAGQRPAGNNVMERLLRIGDVKKKDMTQKEKILAPEISRLNHRELDTLITDIDKRNETGSGQRAPAAHSRRYRRNPVLSTALKLKYKDRCQVCGTNSKVERGFFCDTHHLKPLRTCGLDISNNILVLCPNHHRIFDRSKVRVITRNGTKLVVKASDQTFDINP